jgi:hypothetical protein
MTSPAIEPTTADAPERGQPAQRGLLVIEERAAQHVVEGIIERKSPAVSDPQVNVVSLGDDGVELDVSVTLEYPSDPLSGVLATLRRDLAAETARQLGRPVRRMELTVAEFVTSRPAPPRRVM